MNVPPSSWWLSFADGDLPKGQQFLGACIVRAPNFGAAVGMAHLIGCNPGGEAQGAQIPDDVSPLVEEQWRHRLLDQTECETLDALIESLLKPTSKIVA